MITIEIKLTNTKAREYGYFLGNRYGKKKSLDNMCKIAIMEIVLIQARKEVDESLEKI